MSLNLKYGLADRSDAFVNGVVSDILKANTLMSVATIKDGQAYINTAYFCFNEHLDIFFLSHPESQHSLNIGENESVAISVYDSHQEWDQHKKGLQLFATCAPAHGLTILEGGKLYMQRFSGLKKWITNIDDLMKNVIESKLYVAKVNSFKVFDEDVLGEGISLSLTPRRA
ncbi:MAG: pyridoxamine 5'-phosphate oxidase family protein [Alphaproteobacteria bacterium]|nr:pyridoxamine 5'-phosphate oxidase family protein [Alphaproteobacteria bacterium]